MTHYNCHNPKHKGGTCCDCYPKINCSWEHSEDKPKQTPDRIDEIIDEPMSYIEAHTGDENARKELKTKLQAHIDAVVEEVIKSINGIKLEHTKQDNFGSTSKADMENRSLEKHKKLIISNLRQRYKEMKEKG